MKESHVLPNKARPSLFCIDPSHPLARGLVIASLGCTAPLIERTESNAKSTQKPSC